MKVRVLSACMGSGKTTRMIEEMTCVGESIIYIAPLLSECHRIAGTTPVCDESDDPEDIDMSPVHIDAQNYLYDFDTKLAHKNFKHPMIKRGGTKMDDIGLKIEAGENIVSTHALFRNLSQSVITKIQQGIYHLYLDEVLSVFEQYDDLKQEEIRELLDYGLMYLDADGITLRFDRTKLASEYTHYAQVANLCDMGQLSLIDGRAVMWEFPIEAMRAFKSITVATYLYSGSLLSHYLASHNVDVEVIKFGSSPKDIKHLVTVIDDKLNSVGEKSNALSKTSMPTLAVTLSNNLFSFMANRCKAKKGEMLWTCYKSSKRTISKGRYAKSWLACGTKATNQYADTKYVAYLINLYVQPMVGKLLSFKGGNAQHDVWALSEMVQFLWRSQIRKGLPIKVYVPSSRMRGLLLRWLDGEFDNLE